MITLLFSSLERAIWETGGLIIRSRILLTGAKYPFLPGRDQMLYIKSQTTRIIVLKPL
jgi:hypothetical protein